MRNDIECTRDIHFNHAEIGDTHEPRYRQSKDIFAFSTA